MLLVAGDHPGRLRREAAWAHLSPPIPASSGRPSATGSTPAGPPGQANHALWRIAFTRLSSDPATRAYAGRAREQEGLSKKEIIRCLRAYVAREVYPHLRTPAG